MTRQAHIIDPSSVSYNEILNDLFKFIAAQPETKKWTDTFTGGAGTTITELCAALGAFLRYNGLADRRETYISTAQLKRTIYGIADTLGYPINRGVAGSIKIILNNAGASQFWRREIPIATMFGRPLSLAEGQYLVSGHNELILHGGAWRTSTVISNTDANYATVSFALPTLIDDVDNNLFEVDFRQGRANFTRYVEEIADNNIVVKSLIDSIDLIFGSSLLGVKLAVNDQITIKYLEVAANSIVSNQTLVPANIKFSTPDFTCTSVTPLTPYLPPDDLEKIVLLAPAYFSSRRRMVSDPDNEAILLSYPGIISAKMLPGKCMIQTIPPTEKVISVQITQGNTRTDTQTVDLYGTQIVIDPGRSAVQVAADIVDANFATNTIIKDIIADDDLLTFTCYDTAGDIDPVATTALQYIPPTDIDGGIINTGYTTVIPFDSGGPYDDPAQEPFQPTKASCFAWGEENDAYVSWERGMGACSVNPEQFVTKAECEAPTGVQVQLAIVSGPTGGNDTIYIEGVGTLIPEDTGVVDAAALVAATDYSSVTTIQDVVAYGSNVVITYKGIYGDLIPVYSNTTDNGLETTSTQRPHHPGGIWENHCCTIWMAYLFGDKHELNGYEKEILMRYLDKHRIQGNGVFLRLGQRVGITAKLICVIEEGTDVQETTSRTRSYADSLCLKLGGFFHPADLETYLNSLAGVIRAYLIKPLSDKQLVYYKYFEIDSLEIIYTTDETALKRYGDGTEGTGYSE